jgi:hypothetical protein
MALAPLRLSINEDDPSFSHVAYNQKLKVALNGVLQSAVLAYDRCQGWIDRFKREAGETGRFVVEGDDVVVERVRGVVSAWIED